MAAGPVGRAASAGTDQNFTAEVYSYSRNRGLFAGVSLDGSILAIDTKSNKGLYGKPAPATDIIAGKVTTDVDAAKRFERAILASTAGRGAARHRQRQERAERTTASCDQGWRRCARRRACRREQVSAGRRTTRR